MKWGVCCDWSAGLAIMEIKKSNLICVSWRTIDPGTEMEETATLYNSTLYWCNGMLLPFLTLFALCV